MNMTELPTTHMKAMPPVVLGAAAKLTGRLINQINKVQLQ
jgi:hypothetical protein